jgi:hypothetical protein
MLRDNLVELIEPMRTSAGADPLALCIHQQNLASDDRLSCLENPRPGGAESSLTENVTSPFPAEPRQHRVLYFWHFVGNSFLTLLSNCLTNINISDMETCYKMFRREVIQSIPIEENRFGFEPEITVKVAKRRLRIYEIGISYSGRTYKEGKKIGWKDGFRALWCLVKYSLSEKYIEREALYDSEQPAMVSEARGPVK